MHTRIIGRTGTRAVLIAVLSGIMICGAGCHRGGHGGAGKGGKSSKVSLYNRSDALRLDMLCDDAIMTGPSTESLAWLQKKDGKHRTIGPDMTVAQSLAYVQDLYHHGALKILAMPSPDDTWTNELMMVLPVDKVNRRYLLDAGSAADREADQPEGAVPTPDYDQKYAIIVW